MKKIFLNYLSKAINRYLHLDNDSKLRLQKLHGKTIVVELLPLHTIFHCRFNEQGVELQSGDVPHADTKIRGTPLQMMGMMAIKNERQRFFAEDLMIEGDAEVGQQMVALFDDLEIDWEDYLSRIVGDISAHHVGRLVRGVRDWAEQTSNNFSQNINEFAHEEAEWLPTREALQDFFHDVDQLRTDADRLEARIKNLHHKEKE